MSKNRVNPKKAAAKAENEGKKAEVVILGIDVHAERQVVVRQVDGQTPQPAQSFSREGLLNWVARQLKLAKEVWSCYEAGPFGYGLHRELAAMGVKNLVVRPRKWDDYGERVKTDARDARALCEALSRHAGGNRKALGVVRVPSEEEEQARSASRHRECLAKNLQRLAAVGRGNARYYGVSLKGKWWGKRRWATLVADAELPEAILVILSSLRELILAIGEQLREATKKLEESAGEDLPKGLGALTNALVSREVGDWSRFRNRRQVASYTGLCPSERSSGGKRFQGPVNKHGNRRLRRILVEAAWRVIRYQPGYCRLAKWKRELAANGGKLPPGWKKKMVVALARQLMVDLWRLKTGRTDMASLGLVPAG